MVGVVGMSLDPAWTPSIYPVFAWLEIAERLTTLGDGALGEAIRRAMNGRRLGDDAPFDLTDDERSRVQATLAE